MFRRWCAAVVLLGLAPAGLHAAPEPLTAQRAAPRAEAAHTAEGRRDESVASPSTLSHADADAGFARYDRVEIAPTKTSIYIGRVSMTMPPFERSNGVYASSYVARVFPYFFLSEEGRLEVAIADEGLQALARGEPVEFRGQATNTAGEPRRIEGRAVPTDAVSGNIKVRVFVSKRIQLIFNTTYRFSGADAAFVHSPAQ